MAGRPLARALNWAYLSAMLAILYLPLIPPVLTSVSPTGRNPDLSAVTFRWFGELGDNPVLTGSVRTSLVVALIVGTVTPVLALLGAMAVREVRWKRLLLLVLLLPLFIPGVSMGLSSAFYFQQLGILPSLWTIAVVNIMWALPFAFMIVLTAMSTFDQAYLHAAYVHGADRWRAFLTVEMPLIWPGLTGATTFSVVISFNETVRTSLVQGPFNTMQTFIWSRFLQVGLTPPIYALMSLMILLTLLLIGFLAVADLRRARPR